MSAYEETGMIFGWTPSPSSSSSTSPSTSPDFRHAHDLPTIEPLGKLSSQHRYIPNTRPSRSVSFGSYRSAQSPGYSTDTTPPSSTLTSSDRRAIRNRMRNPAWVPRPRNAFIIFRCEYASKHAKHGSASGATSATATDTTLSKRAGEAWKRLSDEEHEHYKALADAEKLDHALRNPDYRFNPSRNRTQATGVERRTNGKRQGMDRCAKVAQLMKQEKLGSNQQAENSHDWEDSVEGSSPEGSQTQDDDPSPPILSRQRSVSSPFPHSRLQKDSPTTPDAASFSTVQSWAKDEAHGAAQRPCADEYSPYIENQQTASYLSVGMQEAYAMPFDMSQSAYPSTGYPSVAYDLSYPSDAYATSLDAMNLQLANWTYSDSPKESSFMPSDSTSVATPQSDEVGLALAYPSTFNDSPPQPQQTSYFSDNAATMGANASQAMWMESAYDLQSYSLALDGTPVLNETQEPYDLHAADNVRFEDFFHTSL